MFILTNLYLIFSLQILSRYVFVWQINNYWLIDRYIDSMTDTLIDRYINRSIDRSIDWLIDKLNDCLTDWISTHHPFISLLNRIIESSPDWRLKLNTLLGKVFVLKSVKNINKIRPFSSNDYGELFRKTVSLFCQTTIENSSLSLSNF